MIIRWDADPPQADREALAAIYEVSERTIRRHCRPVGYTPQAGHPRGGGRALYDAIAAADELEGVAPRPERRLAELRRRQLDPTVNNREVAQWPK